MLDAELAPHVALARPVTERGPQLHQAGGAARRCRPELREETRHLHHRREGGRFLEVVARDAPAGGGLLKQRNRLPDAVQRSESHQVGRAIGEHGQPRALTIRIGGSPLRADVECVGRLGRWSFAVHVGELDLNDVRPRGRRHERHRLRQRRHLGHAETTDRHTVRCAHGQADLEMLLRGARTSIASPASSSTS